MTYHDRLRALTDQRGTLCVGIDPQPSMLKAWGLNDDAHGLEICARSMVEALGDLVAVFKPQSAFYETYGSAGIAVLERVLADIRDAGAMSILDVKRGDIGSTMAGYAQAYLTDGAPLAADAITVSPYLGFESLRPAIGLAATNNRGIYVLARTSNPEGAEIQLAGSEGRKVAQLIVDHAQEENTSTGLHHIGLVVGATHADTGIDLSSFTGSILAPGVGAQGGTLGSVENQFAGLSGVVLPSASREIMHAGPSRDDLRTKIKRYGETL